MKIVRRLRLLCGLTTVLILMLSTPLLDAHSVAYAQDSKVRETIVLADGTRVVKDMIIVYPIAGGDNKRVVQVSDSFDVSLACGISETGRLLAAAKSACPRDYTLTRENDASPEYKLEPSAGNSAENLAEDYVKVVEMLGEYLGSQSACVTDARLVVAGNGWNSGGNGWNSGSTGETMTYAEAYEKQWSLEMIQNEGNVYGTGSGVQAAFIDAFDHATATRAGMSILDDSDIVYTQVLPDSLDLTLHGNVVHSIFKSVAPDLSKAFAIPVFNSAGEAVNVSVVRGVELALAKLPANSVLNMSFGIDTDSIDSCTYNELEQLFKVAVANDIIPVASAGNSGSSMAEYPAASEYVHNVAAVGPNYEQAEYSNRGDIAAPGGIEDDALIVRMKVQHPRFPNYYPVSYAEATGTSFAAPHVGAVITNLLSDGIPRSDISDKLEGLAKENCDVITLNSSVEVECPAGEPSGTPIVTPTPPVAAATDDSQSGTATDESVDTQSGTLSSPIIYVPVVIQ